MPLKYKGKTNTLQFFGAALTGGAGQTSRTAAVNSLLPVQTSNTNYFLKTDGTDVSWAQAALTVTNDTTTDSTYYIPITTATTGTITSANVSSTSFTYNPSTKLLSAGKYTGNVLAKVYQDKVTAVTASGGATTIDLSLGNSFVVTMNSTTTFTFSNPPAGTDVTSFTIITYNGAGGYAITWPGTVTWAGAQTPARTTTSGKSDAYTFFTRDAGTSYVGSLAILNY
jgi:hypothetical protein